MHLDMDAFFAAVEEREKPRLKGRPIIIGADPDDGNKKGQGRGVVSTANYAARSYGIHSAQPISAAWRLAEAARKQGKPQAVFILPRHRLYADASRKIIQYIEAHVDAIEVASIDEAYADISSVGSYKQAEALAKSIQQAIAKREHLSCSIGIGPNKLIAKIASGFKKPHELTIIPPEMVQKFLDPMPVETLPGIGKKTLPLLHAMGIRTVKNLRETSEAALVKKFGAWGAGMTEHAKGEGSSVIEAERDAKSIGEQITLPQDSRNSKILIPELLSLCQSVRKSAENGKFKFHTVAITVRFADFTTVTRAHTFDSERTSKKKKDKNLQLSLFDSLTPPEAIRILKQPADIIEYEALKLFLPFLDARENPQKKKIRLVGVRVE